MQYNEAKALVQMQADLIDTKVELAVIKAINQVVEQILNLRSEVHQEMRGLRDEMHKIDERLGCVETALGLRTQAHSEVHGRFLDYTFKSGWLIVVAVLSGIFSYLGAHFHNIFQ